MNIMTFPNAYEGVKKIFTAQILEIIASVVAVAAGIAAAVFIAAANSDAAGAAIGSGTGMLVFGLGASVLGIIALILTLVGLKRAGIDEDSFRQGFITAIIVLALKIAYGILSSVAGTTIFDDMVLGIANILEVGVTMYVIRGIGNLAEQLGDYDMTKKGNNLFLVYAIILVISTILRFVGSIVSANSVAAIVAAVIAIIAGIGSVVAYIIYLVYLSQAKKMLSEK